MKRLISTMNIFCNRNYVISHHGDTEALKNDFRRKTYRADNWGSDRSSSALRESRGLSFDFSLCLCASVVR
jgi:hypothetical protein